MARPRKVRIIAGHWRGRKLEVLDQPGLRPTPDRLRETLFNWLQMEIVAASCLDLFAGTGALGFEALSREASAVTMVESNRELCDLLIEQASCFGSERHDIQQADALSWLQFTDKRFDIIFLDPPFHQDLIASSCQIIQQRDLLRPKGKLYVEAEKELNLPHNWQVLKHKQTGRVQTALLAHKDN